MVSKEQFNTLCMIVEEEMRKMGLSRDWVHGPDHPRRVLENLDLLLEQCDMDPKLADNLRVAVILHDARRCSTGDHARDGAEFSYSLHIEGLNETDKENIFYAIACHNQGLKALGIDKAENDKDKLLGYLVLVDHMDVLGFTGYCRVLEWHARQGERFSLLGEIPAAELRRIVDGQSSRSEVNRMGLKSQKAVLPHLVFNLSIAEEVLAPMKHLLSGEFLEEFEFRKLALMYEIEDLLALQEKNEKANHKIKTTK